jgi:lipopolysaccharide/colanic/teichoic acid biosynthesis glycosyltransferase
VETAVRPGTEDGVYSYPGAPAIRDLPASDSIGLLEQPRQQALDEVVEVVVPRTRSEWIARGLNVALAAVALVALAPLMAIIAAVIWINSPGPVIHAQSRVGLDRRWRSGDRHDDRRQVDVGGRIFTIYKFRTMSLDAESSSGEVWATPADPRIIRGGRLIRRFRLDELPQFWNVLKGDMNIVGPRPERPSIAVRLRGLVPSYHLRHRVKPGITGLAQINQHYDATLADVESKLRWDLEYIRRQSVATDLLIMALTVPSVLIRFRGW